MKLYVFETDKWLESDVVYPHDIALCLHPEQKTIYIWEGAHATPVMRDQAHVSLDTITHKFQGYKIMQVDANTPKSITTYIEQSLNTSFEEVEKIDRDPQYVAFYYILIGLFLGLGIGYFMILRIIGWERVSGESVVIISEVGFASWVNQNFVILIVLASIFAVALVFAGLTEKIFLIITASVGVIILTGTCLYFRLGVFLFDFKAGSPLGYYYISIGATVLFFFLNLIALGIILVPMVISLYAIRNTTTPISWADWKEKRKKKVVEMKKFSVLDVASEFTEVDQDLETDEIDDPES